MMSNRVTSETRLYMKKDPDNIANARKVAAFIAEKNGMKKKSILDCTLALTEACSNAIIHGRRQDLSIEVAIMKYSNSFIIEISDLQNNKEEAMEAHFVPGLGLRLINACMDSDEFRAAQKGQAGLVMGHNM